LPAVLAQTLPEAKAFTMREMLAAFETIFADHSDTGAAERRTRATARVLRLLPVATALLWIISDPSRRGVGIRHREPPICLGKRPGRLAVFHRHHRERATTARLAPS